MYISEKFGNTPLFRMENTHGKYGSFKNFVTVLITIQLLARMSQYLYETQLYPKMYYCIKSSVARY